MRGKSRQTGPSPRNQLSSLGARAGLLLRNELLINSLRWHFTVLGHAPLSWVGRGRTLHRALHWFNAPPDVTYTPRTFMDNQLYGQSTHSQMCVGVCECTIPHIWVCSMCVCVYILLSQHCLLPLCTCAWHFVDIFKSNLWETFYRSRFLLMYAACRANHAIAH